jgi:glycosyltransferase involved in cell wall biosynthesis
MKNKKISYVIITDGQRINITNISIISVLCNLKSDDELIIVGNTSFFESRFKNKNIIFIQDVKSAENKNISKLRNTGENKTSGDYVVTMDDDVVLPPDFVDKLQKFIQSNTYDVFNVRMYNLDGGRWWDRCIYLGKNYSKLVDYTYSGDNLYYTGTFLVRSRKLISEVCWNEDHLYKEEVKDNEDIIITKDLNKIGQTVNIDLNNFIIHFDSRYKNYILRKNPGEIFILDPPRYNPKLYLPQQNSYMAEKIKEILLQYSKYN